VWDAESGQLHRELEGFTMSWVTAMTTFTSANGQEARLAAGSPEGRVRIYDPEVR
jgi:hypothetical protein